MEILASDWRNWACFCTNFRKFWKYDPCLYQFLHWIRGHCYTRRLILWPISAAHPWIDLCTKNPPPPVPDHVWYHLKIFLHTGKYFWPPECCCYALFTFSAIKKNENCIIFQTQPVLLTIVDLLKLGWQTERCHIKFTFWSLFQLRLSVFLELDIHTLRIHYGYAHAAANLNWRYSKYVKK